MNKGEMTAGYLAGDHYGHEMTTSGNNNRHHHSHNILPKGDLPDLWVDKKGMANKLIYSRNITLNEIIGRAIIIHKESTENGGGERIACGFINDNLLVETSKY